MLQMMLGQGSILCHIFLMLMKKTKHIECMVYGDGDGDGDGLVTCAMAQVSN